MAANNPTRQAPGPSKDPQHVHAVHSSPGAGSESSPAVSSAFDFGLHQFYTNTSSIRPATDTSHEGYAKDLFDVEWDLEKYKKMNREEQMAYKMQLMQAARRRGKDILKEVETRFNQPSSTAEVESLKQSLLQMTKTQNAAMSAAEEAINNPGKKTAELWQIVEPMRPHILHEYGAGMLAQLDALFQQEAIKEQSEQSPAAHRLERSALKSAASDIIPGVTGVSEHSGRSQRHLEREVPMHIGSHPSEGGETERREVRLLKEYRSRGEWQESGSLIMSLSAEEQLQPEIAIHIGWNLIEQGYPQRALDVTDRSWQRWKASWGERPLVAALRLLRAYCRVVCRCELKTVFEATWSIRSLGSSPTTIENLPDAQIVAEYWNHKLIQEAFKEGLIDEQVFKPLVRQRLTAIVDFLHGSGRTMEAALFEVVRCECSDTREERLTCLRPFLTRSIADHSSEARVLLKFAAILTRYGDEENAWTALRRAEECFGARGSGTCRLESRLIRNQAVRPVNLNGLFGFVQLKQEFRDLGYPDGELRALSAAASTASEIAANGGLTLTYYEELAGIARATGNDLQLLREGLKVFSALSSNPSNVGKVIEGLQRCFETASDQMPASAGMAGMRLSQVYLAVGDREKSLKYANLSRECLRQTWKHELLSDATSGLARVLAAGNAFQDHMDALNLLQNSLKADQGHNYLRGQAEKLDQLASLEGS
ncbi:hypothetical protein B0J12DRAFT_325656 [Macrophomina phaseolina]|uniref:Tetratricopeptide-like helical n=1 Tax=Macrophomina phaseolina TaxID=35725 RepID=A0ABQ8FV45_9PEZI|nr:hypothetical protein B0J12DRAFT_325656 [Macrophomina phaseolina]